jgi:hypothetical protein
MARISTKTFKIMPQSTKGGNQSAEPLNLKVAKGSDLELGGVTKRQQSGAWQCSAVPSGANSNFEEHSVENGNLVIVNVSIAALAVKFVSQQIGQRLR